MRPPCEVVVRRLLPVLRALVAKELMTTYGWTQSQAARRLGVTQPAVSTYLSLLDKDSTKRFDMEELNASARRIAAGMATGGLTLSDTVTNVCELCISLKSGGIVCSLHKQRVPELRREACEACLHLFGRGIKQVEERYDVLRSLKRAVALVEECEEFTAVMPEIRVNVVMAVPEAKSVSEVAGVPGRIIEVRGRARAFMEPEFGSSYHLARVLLAAMEKDEETRAVTNIKYDDTVREALRKLEMSVVEFDRADIPHEALESEAVAAYGVKQTVGKLGGVPDVIVDKGEHGIEPASYVFGKNAVEAVEKAVKIAKTMTP